MKIAYIKKYIEDNLKEKDGGRWEYIIRPEIRDIINDLNEFESEVFSNEILNWIDIDKIFVNGIVDQFPRIHI